MGSSAFSFSPLSIPFIAIVVGLVAYGLLAVLLQGNSLIRSAVLVVAVSAMPWAAGSAFMASCTDPVVAVRLARFYVGSAALVGPALLLLVLAVAGRLERYRWLVVLAWLSATTAAILCWSTDLVIPAVWKTPWGMYYSRAGPLNAVIAGNVVLWLALGVLLARRSAARARHRLQVRRLVAMLVATALCATDALLARGIGVYPLSVVPGAMVIGSGIISIVRDDVLHARGFDRASGYELGLFFATAVVTGVAILLLTRAGVSSAGAVAGTVVPLFVLAQVGMLAVRRRLASQRQAVASEADRALERFIELSEEADDERELGRALTELFERHTGVTRVRLHIAGADGRWQPVDGEGSIAVDARVRVWMAAKPDIIVIGDLPTRSLGGIREPVHTFMDRLDADVIVPLVDRGKLVGGIAASEPADGRALRDSEQELIRQAAEAVARALTYLSLFRDAAARMEVSREVEVAAAVQHARSPGERMQLQGGCQVISYYQPASQFGGDWWSSFELPDGRLLVTIGDITGHGVPAALISATVEGACETAQRMLGANLEVLALLELLDRSVREIGGDDYAMSCFAAVIDAEASTVSFANAGHPFPYVVRRSSEQSNQAELRALVSRGTLLGTAEPHLSATSLALEPDDLLVFYSDSLVDSRSPEKKRYGDRRLQRLLRRRVRGAGEGACRVIMEEAQAHYGDEPIIDDITLIVIRLPGAIAR